MTKTKRGLVLSAGVLAMLGLAACGGSAPSATACKTAMTRQMNYSESHPGSGKSMTEPGVCNGLPGATLRQIAGQVVDQGFKKAMAHDGA